MALYLRRAAEQFPRANWEPSNEHLAIMSGKTVVGTLIRQAGATLGDRWFWSITCVLTEDTPTTATPRRAGKRRPNLPPPGAPG